ncbi:MAG: thioredoxin [Geminicoccaceae bacterium]
MADHEHVKEVNDLSFADDVLQAEGPVLVDFSAGWCGPCQALAPILESVAETEAGRVAVVKLDVDHNPATTLRYGIRGLPTLLLFKGGEPVASHVGAMAKARLKDWINSAI